MLEGVGYALADGMDVVHACGVKPESVTLIGGGARSAYWRQMLADISGQQLDFRTGGDVGPALGAARLAQLALHRNVAFPICSRSSRWNRLIFRMPSALRVTPPSGNFPPDLSAAFTVDVLKHSPLFMGRIHLMNVFKNI